MVDIAPVKALNHEVPREAEVFTDFDRLFVDHLRAEVLCDATVVDVAELVLIVLMIEQVVNVDEIDVALNTRSVNPIFRGSFITLFC